MEPYLAPISLVEPLIDAGSSGVFDFNWLAVLAVVLITGGQTILTRL